MRIKIKIFWAILGIVIVFAMGCSTNEKNNQISSITSNQVDKQEEEVYFWENNKPEDTVAVIINNFTDDQYSIFEDIKKIVLDDSKEGILIVAAKDDVNIEIWTVDFVEDKIVDKELKFEKKSAQRNFAIELQGYRSEGIPNYKIKVSNNLGSLEYYLIFDGKNGTPDIEYLTY